MSTVSVPGPADETVDRVSRSRLVERELVRPARALVGAGLEPVRPGDEDLPAPGGGHFVLPVAVDDVAPSGGVGADSGADLDDNDPLGAGTNLDLLAGRQTIPHQAAIRASRWSPTRSEFAIAVRAGLTAPIDGKTLVSTT